MGICHRQGGYEWQKEDITIHNALVTGLTGFSLGRAVVGRGSSTMRPVLSGVEGRLKRFWVRVWRTSRPSSQTKASAVELSRREKGKR